MDEIGDWGWLRERLAGLAGPPPHWAGCEDTGVTRASVLVPLVERHNGIHVVLTVRSRELRAHAGQISFPGGRIDAVDATPLDTALRETREEIGVGDEDVELLGGLPTYRTGTGFVVLPHIARLTPTAAFRCCPIEVAEIFEVPLGFVLDERNHRAHVIEHGDGRYRLCAMPYEDYFIWGATAGMLLSLYSGITGRAPAIDPQGERL